MMRIFTAAILCTLLFASPACSEQRKPDPVYDYESEDARMNGAIEEALKHLPRFFAAFDAAPEEARSGFMVKVGLDRSGGGREHIWVDSLRAGRRPPRRPPRQ
jgi:hypothetical protein